ncbi:hypothetical protein [Bauldia sp.]|uniref:COG3904 family protein n=1 Tax=Bauldia sp. TaxID=2575872 RepID=UPI003BA93E7E
MSDDRSELPGRGPDGWSAPSDSGTDQQVERPFSHPSRKPAKNVFAAFWRGELSLGVSYWVFGFLGGLFVAVLLRWIESLLPEGYDPVAIFISLYATVGLIGAFTLWQMVGIWRSASRHAEERRKLGRSRFWARTAQVLIVLGLIRLLGDLGGTVPALDETYQMAFLNDPEISDYQVSIADDGKGILVTGGFKYGLAKELQEVLSSAPDAFFISLNSEGGRIGEAEAVFDLVREHGLVTHVGGECLSACVIAFAASEERFIDQNGRLGFHAADFPGLSKQELEWVDSDFASILTEAGFDEDFVERGLLVPHESMWYPTIDELVDSGAVTGVIVDGEVVSSSDWPLPEQSR